MNTILGELGKSQKFVTLINQIEKEKSPIMISGLTGVGMVEMLTSINEYSKKPILIVTYNEIQAKEILENIKAFTDKGEIFPKKEIVTYDYIAESKDLPYERIEVLTKIKEKRSPIIITTIEALLQKLPPKEVLFKNILHFKVGDTTSLDDIKKKLVNLGYVRCDLIEGRGQFSIRGGILDISISEKIGVRIEFWGDEIDSIRNFAIASQRSINTLEKVNVYPAHEYILEGTIKDVCNKIKNLDEMKNKKEMIRVLKTAEDEIVLDVTGKKNGRGAYICFSRECLEKASQNHGLERSLKASIPEEVYESLEKEFDSIGEQ